MCKTKLNIKLHCRTIFFRMYYNLPSKISFKFLKSFPCCEPCSVPELRFSNFLNFLNFLKQKNSVTNTNSSGWNLHIYYKLKIIPKFPHIYVLCFPSKRRKSWKFKNESICSILSWLFLNFPKFLVWMFDFRVYFQALHRYFLLFII